MPIDRFGNQIRLAWSDHEILWVKAALTLPRHNRMCAYRDISEMSHRTLGAVQTMARKIWAAGTDERAEAARALLVPVRRLPDDRASRVPDDLFRWPSRAALRGGKASRVKSPAAVP